MKMHGQRLTNQISLASLLLLQTAQHANGHYGYPFVIVDDVPSARWEYIRPTTSFAPNWGYSTIDAMCGVNASKPLFPIKTLQVEAGSTVVFGASGQSGGQDESIVNKTWNPSFTMYHDGPATAYLSLAPGELADYEGDGEWFKIAAVGASDGINWDYRSMARRNTLNFTIPKTTPPGKYLMRAEHLNMQQSYQLTEMYINCAHIEVTGPGGGKPGPTIKFPGAFDAKDPGIWLPNALYQPYRPLAELKNWQGAGPKVWTG